MSSNRIISCMTTLLLAVMMMVTMSVSVFAEELQPYNADATKITAYIDITNGRYSAVVNAPTNASKINMTATLYEKKLLGGYKEIDSMSASASGHSCSKSKAYAFDENKKYKLEVTAGVYSGGVWDTVTATVTAP